MSQVSSPVTRRPSAPTTSSGSIADVLLGCGVASSALYIAMNAIVPMGFPGYGYATHTVSELSAIGAPTRTAWVALAIVYEALVVAFGVGIWLSSRDERRLRITGALFVVYALFGLAWPPMHLREVLAAGGGTLTDTLHIAWTIVTVPLMLAIIGFGASVFGPVFRLYSLATVAMLAVFGALTSTQGAAVAANLPTPWIGVWERICIGSFIVWVVALAMMLLARGTPVVRRR